jgi:hypothetical protein
MQDEPALPARRRGQQCREDSESDQRQAETPSGPAEPDPGGHSGGDHRQRGKGPVERMGFEHTP